MSVTHDPERRRDVAHVGPIELYTPVLEESRNTVDLEFNHELPQWGAHHFIYGLTCRI